MNTREFLDELRHYGEIIADNTIFAENKRITTFKYNSSIYRVTMQNGNIIKIEKI